MNTYDPTAIRLQLLANGYFPTPNLDKRCMLKGWASQDFVESLTPDTITAWKKQHRGFKATGLLVRNGLMPIDLDISDLAMVDAVLDRLRDIAEDVHGIGPWRTGRYPKLMIFARWRASTRYPDKFTRIASDKFIDEAGQSHQIEIFGGAPSNSGGSSKQVGAFGPHSEGIEYRWEDNCSPLTMAFDDLPAMTQDQGWELLAAFETLAKARGWRRQELPRHAAAKFNYDITPETLFEPEHGGDKVSFYDLEEGTRVSGSFIDGSSARRDKCSVLYCKAKGTLGVFDHENEAWHLPVEAEPPTLSGLEPLSDVIGSGELPKGSKRDDFHAFLPLHQYIYKHTGELWLIGGINTTLDKVVIGQKAKKQTKKQIEANEPPEMVDITIPASLWLDRHRPITQMSWAPGHPQVIKDRTVSDGGWNEVDGAVVFNKYRPPVPAGGNPNDAVPWLSLVRRVYPDHADHIIRFMAHRVQRAEEKINHALVLTGSPGLGKDTILEPLKHAVGAWNFREISPQDVTSNNNDYMQSVVLRVSEARDLGDVSRYAFYEHTKTMTAAPPDMVRVNIKHVPQFYVSNVTGVIFTTNYSADGLYLPPDDRRHYVCGTELTRADFNEDYFSTLWAWYENGGLADVAAYLTSLDLSAFDAKVPPVKTPAFWRMVDAGRAPEEADMRQAVETCGGGEPPDAITVLTLQLHASTELLEWLRDRKNRRNIPRRMESIGYEPVRNADRDDGLWLVGGRPQVIYGRRSLEIGARYLAAVDFRKQADEAAEKAKKALKSNITPFRS